MDVSGQVDWFIDSLRFSDLILTANLAMITETSRIMVVSPKFRVLSLIFSYLYFPLKMMVTDQWFFEDIERLDRNDFIYDWHKNVELLEGFQTTIPEFLPGNYLCDKISENSIDAMIYFVTKEDGVNQGAYDLSNDQAFNRYVKVLHYGHRVIKKNGVLIITIKPVWLLKTWDVLHQLSFQVDYPSSHIYLASDNNPDTLLVLRLTKVTEINITIQKKNILHIMESNQINRLFAFKNQMVFPYAELLPKQEDPFIEMEQKREDQQYFFTLQTTQSLADLCHGYTACLATPSIALYASEKGANIVLFEQDSRFRNMDNLKYVKYDLYKGLNPLTKRKYSGVFNTVICDPPFNLDTSLLARNCSELIKADENSRVYIVFPESKKGILINSMRTFGFTLDGNLDGIDIQYSTPPKIVRWYGKKAIGLFQFKLKEQRG